MNKLFGFLPLFAAPIPAAAIIWAIMHFTGYETRFWDGVLFWVALALCVVLLVVFGRRERRLNNQRRP